MLTTIFAALTLMIPNQSVPVSTNKAVLVLQLRADGVTENTAKTSHSVCRQRRCKKKVSNHGCRRNRQSDG